MEVKCLQAAGICDHLCLLSDKTLVELVGDAAELGGSRRCNITELRSLLSSIPDFRTKAGGSAANVARALAAGFSVRSGLVGARGDDEWGEFFVGSLARAGVGSERVRVHQGSTGRSVILTSKDTSQRTMRTFISTAGTLAPEQLSSDDFAGAKWVFLSAYAMYVPGLLRAASQMAMQEGASVMLDLASFEVVREHGPLLKGIISDGLITCCICNEDEARELLAAPEGWSPEDTLAFLLQHCSYAVITLGSKGCIAGSQEMKLWKEPAVPVNSVDSTGAGDTFCSGFLYGLLRGLPLARCASIGCLAGAAAVQTVGAELSPANWQWLHRHLHSDLAAEVIDTSAEEVCKELLEAYALIARLGVGAVYFGSARLGPSSDYWSLAVALAHDVALLLECPTWTGGGPGMMQAVSEGALAAGRPVGAVKIARESGQLAVRTADYLPAENTVVCKYMPARKAALTDSGVRKLEKQRTAHIFLPGGLGTLDELFAILTLVQLNKLNTSFPVPLIIVNYNCFYDGLLGLLQAFDTTKVLQKSELDGVFVARSNEEVLGYLAEFYSLPPMSI